MNFTLEEALRQPFGSQGGKKFMASRLVRMIPDHKVYVEAFMGGGAVFWKKNPSEKEAINDIDPRIIKAYRFIQSITEEQWTELKKMYWTANKKIFGEVLKDFKNSKDARWFHDFMYLKQFSNLGEMKTFENRDLGTSWAGVNNLMRMKKRLENVEIHNEDYRSVIKKYDGPDTFFYIDPPYPNAAFAWNSMPKESEVEETVNNIKGKFLLSYELSKAFGRFNKTTIELMSIASPAQKKENFQKKELLVSNYKVIRNTKYLNEALIQDGYEWLEIFHECFIANGYGKDWLDITADIKRERISEALKDFEVKIKWGMKEDILRASRKKGFKNITEVLEKELAENVKNTIKHPQGIEFEFGAQMDSIYEYFYEEQEKTNRIIYRQFDTDIQAKLKNTVIKCVLFNNLFDKDIGKKIQEASDDPHKVIENINLLLDGDISVSRENPGWLAIRPVDQTPYVLTKESIDKSWLSPAGTSALPKKIEDKIPGRYAYWDARSEAEALKIRDALCEAIKKKEVLLEEARHSHDRCMNCAEPPAIEVLWANGKGHAWFCEKHFKIWGAEHKGDIDYIKKIKDGKASQKFSDNTNPNIKESRFALQHHWKKGFMAEHWDLRVDTGTDNLMHMTLEYSPLKENNIAFRIKESKDKAWMTKGVKIERINEEIPSYIQMVDSGIVILQEHSEKRLELDFQGKKLKGSWIAEKDDSSSDWWILKPKKGSGAK